MNSAWSAFANGAVLSVPLVAALWISLRLISRRYVNAATRYAIWWIALATTTLLPAIFLANRAAEPVSAPAVRRTAPDLVLKGASPEGGPAQPRPPASSFTLHLPLAIPAGAWMRWLVAAWMTASAALLLRLLLSHLSVRRTALHATELPPGLRERAQTWRFTNRPIRLAVSAKLPIPVATGPFHPTILLPAALLHRLAEDDLDQIGLHEAAHLARRDDCALLLERILEALFSLHPVVRWVTRQIDLEREIACDDLVVETTGHARRYADCLTRVVALCGAVRGSLAVAHAAGNRSHLSQRVELLVDRARDTRPRLLGARLTVFAAALIGVAFLLARMPGPLAFASQPKETPVKKLILASAAAAVIAVQPAPTQTSPTHLQAAAAGPVTPQTQARPAGELRQLVLFFDNFATTADQNRTVAAAEKFVESQLKPTDVVAVMSFTDKIQVLQDFTGDRDLLLKAIGQVAALPAASIDETPSPETTARQLAALETAVRMLGSVSGKKALIYFSRGLNRDATASQSRLQATINSAIRANVSFYPIDVRGVVEK